ncbi:hypothetical protein ACMDB5_09770 [Flavobacterium sp. W1B]|uniref:hypothetical protein n=1 Tax=Flavobacterium sp. W1B TaxID=3394146 RepID=UPI0039BD6892
MTQRKTYHVTKTDDGWQAKSEGEQLLQQWEAPKPKLRRKQSKLPKITTVIKI